MRSLASLFIAPSPEKIASKELHDMRMALFQAERRLLEAQMQVDYYREMVGFLEDVSSYGVERVVDQRHAAATAQLNADDAAEHSDSVAEVKGVPQPAAQPLNAPAHPPSRLSPGLTTVPIVPSAA
ncbi:hypothetical protein [Cupriavidus sp. AU9028]|uniref:hypothetical protein n=1 Tax=Cupriavidus sp. AU9028 TaxID=2871157 RepID=UPI001C960409|nr:hypothetical protein [Cupriavidus sp. AU9028]MBY4896040.1 hypothetical protein [Cupriavidus sp. AU9028]